jgi:serine/threonine-protein phosphatase 4 regulatory subunit 4
MIGHFGGKTCSDVVLPMIVKICERAKREEDETLPKITHHFGRVCHAVDSFLTEQQRKWFVEFFVQLARTGLAPISTPSPATTSVLKITASPLTSPMTSPTSDSSETKPMPDLLPQPYSEKSDLHAECRQQCAYNFPAMVLFAGPENFVDQVSILLNCSLRQ